MRTRTWIIGVALLAAPLLMAAAHKGEEGEKCCMHEEEEGVPKEEAWGGKLNQTVTISMWGSKDGEGSAGKLSTSREVFRVEFEMGKGNSEGFSVEVEGRIFARADGSFEVLLDVEGKGGDKRGGMELEMQNSVIVKKGQAAVVASNKDGQFYIKVD